VPGNSNRSLRPAVMAAAVRPKLGATSKSISHIQLSGLRQYVAARKATKSILVAGWRPPSGRSNAILARAPEMHGLRIWEHPPMTPSVAARPVTVTVARTPAAVSSIPARVGAISSNRWLGQNNAMGTQVNFGAWRGASLNRRVPVKTMLPLMPRLRR
jgi:hypothetical protein